MKKLIRTYMGYGYYDTDYILICDECGNEASPLYVDKEDERELCADCTLATHEKIE